MNRQGDIILHLESVDQLIEPCPPSPKLERAEIQVIAEPKGT